VLIRISNCRSVHRLPLPLAAVLAAAGAGALAPFLAVLAAAAGVPLLFAVMYCVNNVAPGLVSMAKVGNTGVSSLTMASNTDCNTFPRAHHHQHTRTRRKDRNTHIR
jgi:hypothetical protein